MSSSAPAPKRQRTDTDAPYELLYWPGIPGRGEFVRLAFAATETPFKDVSNENKNGVKEVIGLIDASNPDAAGELNAPPLAPPILRHGELVLSQTPAILSYLAPRLGLVPEESEDPDAGPRVLSLALTALDGFSNEPHDVHHPVGVAKYYEDQKAEAKLKAEDYRENRLPKFLAYFERVLDSKSSGIDGWLYGNQLTYADLVLFQGLDGVSFAFPKLIERLKKSGKYDKVWKLYDTVKQVGGVAKYLESDRHLKYGNGIWRHYPELDDE
jgi:glutathione S-transferase